MSALDVLVVCTANRCRSPMGEVLLAATLDKHGFDASVTSAGLMDGGWPAEAEAQQAVQQNGLDLSGHSSRPLDQRIVGQADLVLTMERRHVREIAVRFQALAKTFTIRDFVERAATTPPEDKEPIDAWLSRLNETRDRSLLLGESTDDEVSDPIGKPLNAFQSTRDELQELCERTAEALISYS